MKKAKKLSGASDQKEVYGNILSTVIQPSKEKKEPDEFNKNEPYLSLEHIETGTGRILRYDIADKVQSTKNVFYKGDVLYGKLRPYLNKVAIVDRDGVCSTDILVFRPNAKVSGRFLKYWLSRREVVSYANHLSAGIGMPRISFKELGKLDFPALSLTKQEEVADLLDQTLPHIYGAQLGTERARVILRRFKEVILNLAVTGELTEDWHSSNEKATTIKNLSVQPDVTLPNLPLGWVWTQPDLIADQDDKNALAIGPFGSNLKVSDYRTEGVPLVFVKNIRSQNFSQEKAKFVSVEKAKSLQSHSISAGDILVTKMGDPPGDVCIYPLGSPNAIITADCIKFRVNKDAVVPSFIAYAINSSLVKKQIFDATRGVAQQKISLGRFRSVYLPLPSKKEQEEVVNRISLYFEIVDRVEQALTKIESDCDLVKSSVLLSAFHH